MTTFDTSDTIEDECKLCGEPEGNDELAQYEHMTECHGDILAERRGEVWAERVD